MSTNTTDRDDGLTDEEREALLDEEGTTAEAGDEAQDDIHEEEAGDTGAEAAAAAAATAADEPAAADEQAAPETKQQSAPLLVAPDAEDADGKLNDIAAQKEALLTQFDDGDITAREFQKALDALSKQERVIELVQHEAQLAAKMEQQRQQNEWVATCNAFIDSNSVYKDNPRLYRALDQEVRDLAAKPETANWTGQKFLEEAHKALAEAFGLSDAKTGSKTEPKPQARRDLPPNLAKVPAADVEDTNGGQFAVLDRMANTDPVAYEETLAKMPQAQRDAYLAA